MKKLIYEVDTLKVALRDTQQQAARERRIADLRFQALERKDVEKQEIIDRQQAKIDLLMKAVFPNDAAKVQP